DLEATIDKTVALIEQAAGAGAQLVVFPETWVPGYPYWAWLGPAAWGLQWVQRYFDNSLRVDSEAERRVAEAAREHGIHVVLGCSERAGGSLYMGQVVYDGDGRRLHARRKLKPTYIERIVFGEGGASDLAVHETAIGRLGALCCWEHLQPLTKYAMYAKGEQIHAASWPSFSLYPAANALGPDFNDAVNQVYAGEGGCFVVAASMPISQEIIDLLCERDDQRELIAAGGGKTMIFGPDGSRLAEYLAPDEEGLVMAELDLGLISLAKAAADPAGHYARPDVTRLLLTERSPRPVESVVLEGPEPLSATDELIALAASEPTPASLDQ
ncbi:MAG TPA: carbon-nitrogen hydrolase family protein, partial [Solirubrobacteraceae bacterium]|nr:carbon-nitrogen hydrolase family protein [Solirubrobacteraceae bacterium]